MRSRNRSRTAEGNGAHQLGDEVGVVGEIRREQLLLERDLRVGEQHRELGRGEPEAGVVAVGELFVGGQSLDVAVEVRGRSRACA